jgi:hypothetical protein
MIKIKSYINKKDLKTDINIYQEKYNLNNLKDLIIKDIQFLKQKQRTIINKIKKIDQKEYDKIQTRLFND